MTDLSYAEALELVESMTPEELRELDRIINDLGLLWAPLPGPQTMAYESTAEVVGYGGAAGGGKTDLACGLALTKHRKSAIFRREATQLTAVIDRLTELIGSRDGFSGKDNIWRLKPTPTDPIARQIEFGSTPHLGDENKYQGRPKDLLVLDETANFLESQARFLMGWVRTTSVGQACRTLMTFNPPTSAEGQWIISYFAPWLQDRHPRPAQPGELRYFAVIDGREVEVDDATKFIHKGELILPQSRTFIPSRIEDNPFLLGTGYMRQLQALPEPLRSQMLKGDFRAGMGDDPWQIIPTAWIVAAQERWKPRDRKGTMDSLGVDVARGGRDQLVIARRHGEWFDELLEEPGAGVPDGPVAAAHVLKARRDRAPVHIDIVGWGASPHDFLVNNSVQTVGVNGASGSPAVTEDEARLRFANKRAEIWWRMREALDPVNDMGIALPPKPEILADLAAPRWRLGARGIQVELKDEVIKRIGRSPDRGDALCLALISTTRWEEDPRFHQPGTTGQAVSDYDPFERRD